jgi:hypothetical protein
MGSQIPELINRPTERLAKTKCRTGRLQRVQDQQPRAVLQHLPEASMEIDTDWALAQSSDSHVNTNKEFVLETSEAWKNHVLT